jgi:PAS domain S-box-containing protein
MPPEIKRGANATWLLKFWLTVAECLCGIAAVVLATFFCFRFHVHLPTPSCTYFIIIVLLSLRGNLVSSIIVSLFAVGCLDYYFLPPIFSLSLSDPRDMVSAATFITAAFVISSLVQKVHALMAEKLQKSETYLSEAQRLSHTGSFGWNIATGEITWSEETFRIFQYDSTIKPTVEFLLERVHPEDVAQVKETIERASRDGKDFDVQHRLLMPDGSIKYLHVVAKLVKTKMRILEFVGTVMDVTERKKTEENLHETRTVLEFVGAVMDITERKKTEETLHETRTVLEFALKSGEIGDWDLDLVNDTSRRSLRHDQCFGYNTRIPETDWGLEVFARHLHSEDRARVVGSLQGAIKNLADWNSEFRVIWPDRTIHWLAARGSIYRTSEGKAARMLGVVMDITEKKGAEEALRSSQQKLEEAQRIAHVGYWERDLNTGLIIWSDETYRIYGRPPQESILNLPELQKWIHPEDRETMGRAVDKSLSGEQRYDVEYRVVRPNGEVRFVHSSGDVIKDEAGRPSRMFGTVQDITDRKRAEEARSASERLARGQLEALKSTVEVLAKESDTDRLLENLLRTIAEQFGAHSCSVWLRDRDPETIAFECVFEAGRLVKKTDPKFAGRDLRVPLKEFWPQPDDFQMNKPDFFEDIRKSPRFASVDQMELASLGIVALLLVPMSVGGQLEGGIGLRFTEKRTFRPEEMELAQALASQVMLAIQLMRLSLQTRTAAIISERNRVAQELHDTLLQGFTGIGLRLDAITNTLPPSLASTKEQLQKILEQSDEYLTEARRSVWQLRSPSLESSGSFPEALKKVSERALQGTGIPLHFVLSGVAFKLALDIEDNFLRICEEAVTNAVKHAHPTEIEVLLECTDNKLRLGIRDNGHGFDMDGPDGKKTGHFGLTGIRERTKRLTGDLSLSSQPGQGTEILVTVRLSPESKPD